MGNEFWSEEERLLSRVSHLEQRIKDEEEFTKTLIIALGRTVNAARETISLLREGTPSGAVTRAIFNQRLRSAENELDQVFDTLSDYEDLGKVVAPDDH